MPDRPQTGRGSAGGRCWELAGRAPPTGSEARDEGPVRRQGPGTAAPCPRGDQ
jgi:hypothetical protein